MDDGEGRSAAAPLQGNRRESKGSEKRLARRWQGRSGGIIPAQMGLQPGTKLGTYEIVALLGAGGMGEVYRARDLSLQREVAVKILSASYSQDADRLRRFAASQICTWSKG